jgi:adenylate cyclase
MVSGAAKPPALEDRSQEYLRDVDEAELGFVILSLDVVDSTKHLLELGDEAFNRVVGTMLFEASQVLPIFHGFVLSYVGDGLIAFFPEPSFMRKNDLALDCALTIRSLVYQAIHPILARYDLPRLDIRIGLEAGSAPIITTGSPEAKSQRDIRGAVVSMAKKIEGTAEPGGVRLGEATVRNLHTGWRQFIERVDAPPDWPYSNPEGDSYGVFMLSFPKEGQGIESD